MSRPQPHVSSPDSSRPDPLVTTVRRFIDALNDRDLAGCVDLLDPEVEWHWMDYGPMAGVHHGSAGMKRIIEQFRSRAWEAYRVEPEEVDAAASRVLVIGRMRPPEGLRAAASELPFAWLITIVHGEIVRVLSYRDADDARRALERHRGGRRRLRARDAP